MHVEEQVGVTACKVGEISFWHGADVALDILGQVLIMMFLYKKKEHRGRVRHKEEMIEEQLGWGPTYAPCSEARGGGLVQISHHIS